ncbi:hypothetical protein J3E73DRAFT_379654 [Bipolaris maydis]|nr:hypothetical protein J3E73DRAFT_379654 [Bipolaris maydis]
MIVANCLNPSRTKNPKRGAAAWIVATDSEYVVKGMTEWLPKWKSNNWRTAKGTTPANLDLFLALDSVVTTLESENLTIGFWYIPREHNKIADRLAKAAASFDLHSPSPLVQPARQRHMMSAAAPDDPRILLVSLDTASPFDQLYQGLLGKLNTVAALDRATKPESVLQGLADQPPQAVLVTDSGIVQHRAVYAKLLDYVRGGGRLVFMGNFSTMTTTKDIDRLFQEAGLPWTHGAYQRTTVHRNDTEDTSSHTSLPPSYSQKAVFLAGVPDKDAWYLPKDSSHTESHVFYPVPITDQEQTPIALTNIGKGKLGYVGDVNGEEGSDAVVLAMCGLRDNA